MKELKEKRFIELLEVLKDGVKPALGCRFSSIQGLKSSERRGKKGKGKS